MAGLSAYYEEKILENIFKQQPIAAGGATLYIGLHTADPTDTGLVAELTIGTNDYARATISTDATVSATDNFSSVSADGNSISSTKDITFAEATPNGWGDVSWFSIWTAATNGSCIATGQVNAGSTVTVSANTQLRFPSGQLTLTID